jgi:hypothetical protein
LAHNVESRRKINHASDPIICFVGVGCVVITSTKIAT